MNILLSYSDLKASPGVWGYFEDAKEYRVFKDDYQRQFFTTLDKADYQAVGSDCKDFYDNIKPGIDAGIYQLDQRRSDNKHITHVSERQIGTLFNWTSFFDNAGVQDGDEIGISFTGNSSANPAICEGTFSSDIRLSSGKIFWNNVPAGSDFSFSVYCPNDALYFKDTVSGKPCASDFPSAALVTNVSGGWLLLARYVHIKIPTAAGELEFSSSDLTTIMQGYKLRMTFNSADASANSNIFAILKNCRDFLK